MGYFVKVDLMIHFQIVSEDHTHFKYVVNYHFNIQIKDVLYGNGISYYSLSFTIRYNLIYDILIYLFQNLLTSFNR